jgi:hypothetical protein
MKVFWFVLLLLGGAGAVPGAPVMECGEGEVVNLADYAAMLRDPSGAMTMEDILRADDRGEFVPLDGVTPSLGFSQDAFWFVFYARASEPREKELVAELMTSRMREVDWYAVGRDGIVRHASSSMLPQNDVEHFRTRYPLFAFTVWPDKVTRVYFRVRSDTSVLLPMRVGSVMGFLQAVESRAVWEYAHLGMTLMIMMVSLLGGVLMRQQLYWLLLCMMACFEGYDLIYSGVYAWWNGPWMGFVTRHFMLFLTNLMIFFMVLFTQRFIGRERLGHRLYLGLNIFVIGVLLGGVLVLLVPYGVTIVITHTIITGGFAVGASVSLWAGLTQRTNSRLWLIAIPWVLMLLAVSLLMMQWHGVLPVLISISSLRRTVTLGVGSLFLLALFDKQLAAQRQEKQVLLAQRLASEARLETLRYQLNPHFLYNALNSIEGLAIESPRRIPALVRRLADFLRARLKPSGDFMVSFGEALETTRAYLDIERVRFEERLQVDYDIAEGVEVCRVPEMLLQPLVENAIKYGMTTEEPLHIRIGARRAEGRLCVRVENTGHLAQKQVPPGRGGIGAGNVVEQLKHSYGEAHASFQLREENGWVVASVSLPFTGKER